MASGHPPHVNVSPPPPSAPVLPEKSDQSPPTDQLYNMSLADRSSPSSPSAPSYNLTDVSPSAPQTFDLPDMMMNFLCGEEEPPSYTSLYQSPSSDATNASEENK